MKKRYTFLRSRFYGKRVNPVREPLKKGTGGINPCFKPSYGVSKADLKEFHREDLRLRRHHQLARTPNAAPLPRTKSDDPAYRKSIWPASRIEARRAATTQIGAVEDESPTGEAGDAQS